MGLTVLGESAGDGDTREDGSDRIRQHCPDKVTAFYLQVGNRGAVVNTTTFIS